MTGSSLWRMGAAICKSCCDKAVVFRSGNTSNLRSCLKKIITGFRDCLDWEVKLQNMLFFCNTEVF